MLLTAVVAYYYHVHNNENDYQSFLLTAAMSGVVGVILYLVGGYRKKSFDRDDTFVLVSLSWIIFS